MKKNEMIKSDSIGKYDDRENLLEETCFILENFRNNSFAGELVLALEAIDFAFKTPPYLSVFIDRDRFRAQVEEHLDHELHPVVLQRHLVDVSPLLQPCDLSKLSLLQH